MFPKLSYGTPVYTVSVYTYMDLGALVPKCPQATAEVPPGTSKQNRSRDGDEKNHEAQMNSVIVIITM